MKILFELYWSFFQVGIMTFGGGYAMLPMLQRVVVDDKKWATEEEIMDYYAIGQVTPGVIAVNTATFIGYKQKKILGGICATAGVVSPSLIIIMLLASIIGQFSDMVVVQHAFNGIRIVVCALVAQAVIKMLKKGVKDILTLIICIASFIAVGIFRLSPIPLVVICCFLGIFSKGGEKKSC
ncbi:MAG: chromate transporter [Lachnospiraceae bacterium]|nr:chromate transporter [Lachnospiraceae bacterium]